MESNLTAVEWLEKKLIEAGLIFEVGEAIEVQQAKEMEKQQIIDAYQQGFNNAYFSNPLSKEQYYKQKFNK
jgi:hypothetical protein